MGAYTFPVDYHFLRFGRRKGKRHRFSTVGPDERRRKLEEWKRRQMEKRRRWQENMHALHQERMLKILTIQEKHGMLRQNRSEPRLLV
jgi:hypothetical protein